MTQLETLLRYAERFLQAAQTPSFSVPEFWLYFRRLEAELSILPDPGAADRILRAMPAERCAHILREEPAKKNEVVVPSIERLVEAIRKEFSGASEG